MSLENNILSLNIVKDEVDLTLSQAEVSLDSFDENRSDTSKLTQCIDSFNQLRGTFDMIGMPGAASLSEAMARATEKIGELSNDDRDDALAKISSAIVVLVRYLEYVQLTQSGLPELLVVSINELRALTGEKPISESYFFSLDLTPFEVSDIRAIPPSEDVESPTARLRHMYQVGLLGSFKEENLKTNFKMMARALERLNGLYQDSHGTQLLWVCNGVIDALLAGKLTLTKPRKLILGRIDRQVKQLLNNSSEELDQEGILSLIKDSLYIIALAEPTTDLLKEIHTHFDLAKYNLDEQVIIQERELMTGPSASVIRTVASALREEIAAIMDKLDVLARTESEGEADSDNSYEELVSMSNEFQKIAHTLIMLGLPSASERLNALVEDLSAKNDDFQLKISELADALVFIEHSIARMEKNNTPANETNEELAEEKDTLDLDSVFTTVVVESRDALSKVQRAISEYIELNFDAEQLKEVPDMLHSAWGGVQFLNIEKVAQMLKLSASFIDEQLISAPDQTPDKQKLDTFADALASIDYYLESFEEKKPLGDGILEIAQDSLDELGYKAA